MYVSSRPVITLTIVGAFVLLRGLRMLWGTFGRPGAARGRHTRYRQTRRDPPRVEPCDPSSGSFLLDVAGECFVNNDGSSRHEILARCRPGEPITLRPEPLNSRYRGAIQVLRAETGEQIGYLPRGHGLAAGIKQGDITARLHAVHGGVPGRPNRGAVLEITSRQRNPQPSPPSPSHRLLWPALTAVVFIGAIAGYFAPDLSGWFSNLAPRGMAASSSDLRGRPRIIDGDTIEIGSTRIRLYGIDAPESKQTCENPASQDYACGEKATTALADHVGAAAISCEPRDIDRYGRTVAVCFLGSEDLDAWMVAQGWAVAYRHYSIDYVPQEEAAHAAHLGMWAATFMLPWEWRQQH
jgi:endonuclease YncB( thermonuclease family)